MKKIKTRHLLIGAIFVVGMLVLMITALIANQQKKVYRSRATYPTATPTLPIVLTRTPTPIPTSYTPTPVPECIFHETGNYRCSPIDRSWGTEYIYNEPFVPTGCKTTNPTPPATFWGYGAPNDPKCLTSPTPTSGQGGTPSATPPPPVPTNTQPPPPPPATKTPTPRPPTPTSGPGPSSTPVPATATPVPSCTRKSEGDANCDEHIDGVDYSIWLNSQCHPQGDQQCSDLRSDFDGNSAVDDDDYLIWYNHRNT